MFPGRICPEKFQLDQIQSGRLSAIINFNMPDIWHNYTISIKQNVRFQVWICPEKFQFDQMQNWL